VAFEASSELGWVQRLKIACGVVWSQVSGHCNEQKKKKYKNENQVAKQEEKRKGNGGTWV
jgi:hypothetical protein